jgi:ribose 5-phosphate isomerase B
MGDSEKLTAIGCDHAGYLLKEFLKNEMPDDQYQFADYGTFSDESVDYPDYIHPLAKDVSDGRIGKGIIICGTGNGVAMVANKYPGVRAAVCWNEEIAALSRKHNDANILALPARFIPFDQAVRIVRIFRETPFEGGRHERRVKKIPLIK